MSFPSPPSLRYDVAGIVDDVGVVARPTAIVSAPPRPSSLLLPELPSSVLAEPVPPPSMLAEPVSVRIFDVGIELESNGRQDAVRILSVEFSRRVADIIDDVGVVALAARQGIGAPPAIERILARVPEEGVAGSCAGAVNVGGADERQVIDGCTELVSDRLSTVSLPSLPFSVTRSPASSTM